MALNLYGKTNYEVRVPLSLQYSREPVITKSLQQPLLATQWKYSRMAQKTYLFKGMTEKATKACLFAKLFQYNRKFMQWGRMLGPASVPYGYWHSPEEFTAAGYSYMAKEPYYAQVAQFNVTRMSQAPVFNLEIQVDEIIYLYSIRDYDPNDSAQIPSIENLFAAQTYTPVDQRINDQDGGGPRYNSYLRLYSYDENLTGDTEVP